MNELFNFFRELIPTQIQIVCGSVVSFIGSGLFNALGWNALVEFLVIAMVIDYFTGVLAAFKYKKKHPNAKSGGLNSKRGLLGILRKVCILSVVVFAHYLDYATGISAIHSVVVWFYIGNEGISIAENLDRAGVPIPEILRGKLDQLAHEKIERSDSNASESKHQGNQP